MCKAEYNAEWTSGVGKRCPNLIPTAQDRQVLNLGNATTFPVDVIVRMKYRDHYESLAGLWSEWNRLWLEYSRPRLVCCRREWRCRVLHHERPAHPHLVISR